MHFRLCEAHIFLFIYPSKYQLHLFLTIRCEKMKFNSIHVEAKELPKAVATQGFRELVEIIPTRPGICNLKHIC